MSKIVALNSGGFDSIVMLNIIKDKCPTSQVTSLFFDYGQKSVHLERNCARKMSEKLGYDFKEITLPPFDWTNSDFYNEGFKSSEDEYLEFRNLVFIAYGLSICSSLGASELYVATLKSFGYYDTSPEFFAHLRGIANSEKIEINTPLSHLTKPLMADYIKSFNLMESDFHSCDNPVDEKPCGVCPDCLILKQLFKKPFKLIRKQAVNLVDESMC